MKQFRALTLAIAMCLLAVPLGIVSGVLRTLSSSIDVVTGALVDLLNWCFAGDDAEMQAALEFIANHKDPEPPEPPSPHVQ